MTMLLSRLAAVAAAGTLTIGGLLATATTSSAATTPAPCTGPSLAVTHTPVIGTTSHHSFVLLYRNVKNTTCTIHGYPGLDALTSSGQILTHAQRTLSGPAGGVSAVGTATVTPEDYASAIVEWNVFNPRTGLRCPVSTTVATTAANTFSTVRSPMSVSSCSLQIHPTVTGTSRNTRFAQAQLAWQQGASASSADQGIFWARSAAALALDGTQYTTQIHQLLELFGLPDAMQTPAQNATYLADIKALNRFFGTPTLYR